MEHYFLDRQYLTYCTPYIGLQINFVYFFIFSPTKNGHICFSRFRFTIIHEHVKNANLDYIKTVGGG